MVLVFVLAVSSSDAGARFRVCQRGIGSERVWLSTPLASLLAAGFFKVCCRGAFFLFDGFWGCFILTP
ncbi:Uncharacterized protein TCM_036779 [Theobroma cacao]|uniref:Uncharacterized protein n=1 Tax=Theobroma cacao TaxID=3641 RepID=A0A061GPV2_THECC|nr:Uncharacterized protein TCM_036779 [Theobroma cacao]